MAHYAKVSNGIVTEIIVAEKDFFDTFIDNSPGQWVQTSYNTHGGEHALGGTALRQNFAGIGYSYDQMKDVFIPPRPFPSWNLNEETCLWEAPIPCPGAGFTWDEASASWSPLNP